MPAVTQNLQRETLRKMQRKSSNELIPLRLEYSELNKLLTGYLNKLVHVNRIYPTHLPTQANFRWSTIDPPLTNFPRQCIAPQCPRDEHEWTEQCWSLRDIVTCDDDEVMVSWDHDNVEGRIGAILLDDQDDLEAFRENYDLHTITCCKMFHMRYPVNLRNPHTSVEDATWRSEYNWQGKDTRQRVLAKNFNHGSRYAISDRFVYTIPGIERYGIDRKALLQLARVYIASKREVFERKKRIMEHVKKTRIARNLYGARRVFFDSSEHTAKEGFNHIISSTVSHYNNESIISICSRFESARLMHNKHDGDNIAFKKEEVYDIYGNNADTMKNFTTDLKEVIERPLAYQGREVMITAGVKVYG